MTTTAITVPEGYIHRDALRAERGWSTAEMDELETVLTVDVGTLKNTSNKAYLLEEVQAVEEANPALARRVKKHQDAAASYIPPTPGITYTQENTLGEAQLRARGWSPAHIARLLHHHDLSDPLAARTMRARYGTDRVEAAEANDERLVKTITKHRAKTLAEHKEATEDGEFIFRRYKGEWYAWGKKEAAPISGNVTVRKKDGSSVEKRIPQAPISDPENPGYGYFRMQNPVVKTGTPAAGSAGGRERAPRKVVDRIERVDSERVWEIGEIITVGQKTYTVRYINRHRIGSEDPSIYGSHLLGHEDTWGFKALAYATGAE